MKLKRTLADVLATIAEVEAEWDRCHFEFDLAIDEVKLLLDQVDRGEMTLSADERAQLAKVLVAKHLQLPEKAYDGATIDKKAYHEVLKALNASPSSPSQRKEATRHTSPRAA